METFTLIPHPDVVLKLIEISKKIITQTNSQNGKTILAPNFPLWSFSDDFSKKISDVKIHFPKTVGDDFFYPLIYLLEDMPMESKIVFAKKIVPEDFALDFSRMQLDMNFPMELKIFKTGKVFIQNNGYEVFDEKWTKLKGTPKN